MSNEDIIAEPDECCGNCAFASALRPVPVCRNPESEFFGGPIDCYGYCPRWARESFS